MKQLLTFDNIWKVLTTLAVAGILFLNSHYALKETNDAAHTKITEVLSDIKTSIALLEKNQRIIEEVRTQQIQFANDFATMKQLYFTEVTDLKARVANLERNIQ